MTHANEIHHRALAAATAVVGRERHRLGAAALALLLAAGPLACVLDKSDGADTSATADTGSSGSSGSTAPALTDPSTGALSDATTSDTTADTHDTTLATTGTSTTLDTAPDTTLATTGTGTATGTTDDSTTAAPDTTTGDLDECMGPDGRVDWVCCEAQGWQPAPQCTPWGPPAPPRFDARARRGRLC